jgi:intracellular sulfur oxidation DsrE/DsrF family protein
MNTLSRFCLTGPLALLLCLGLGTGLSVTPQDVIADEQVKVVYHADFADPRRFSAMLTSVNNMMNYYENELVEADVRIVFVAHGIRFLTDDTLEETPFAADAAFEERRENLKGRLLSLADTRGVKLELCDITRSQIGLAKDGVYPTVSFVPSGVVQIADLQRKGFAYIKIE